MKPVWISAPTSSTVFASPARMCASTSCIPYRKPTHCWRMSKQGTGRRPSLAWMQRGRAGEEVVRGHGREDHEVDLLRPGLRHLQRAARRRHPEVGGAGAGVHVVARLDPAALADPLVAGVHDPRQHRVGDPVLRDLAAAAGDHRAHGRRLYARLRPLLSSRDVRALRHRGLPDVQRGGLRGARGGGRARGPGAGVHGLRDHRRGRRLHRRHRRHRRRLAREDPRVRRAAQPDEPEAGGRAPRRLRGGHQGPRLLHRRRPAHRPRGAAARGAPARVPAGGRGGRLPPRPHERGLAAHGLHLHLQPDDPRPSSASRCAT